MSDISLMQVSQQNLDWLNTRQSLVAANVANANTPGYKARDVRPFSETMEQTAIAPTVTHTAHLGASAAISPRIGFSGESAWATFHSGGNVSLEQEMMKASEVASAYRLNTSIMRTFHTLYLAMAQ